MYPLGRKFLAAKDVLVEMLRSVAKGKNVTLYGLTNEILQQAIRANDLGEELPKVVDRYYIVKAAMENRSLLIPERIWYVVLEKALENSGGSLKEVFYDVGLWYGKYFSAGSKGNEAIGQIRQILQTMLWNASSLDLKKSDDEIILRCLESNFTDSHTKFLSTMLEGVMHAFGYTITEKETEKGLLLLTFRKTGR